MATKAAKSLTINATKFELANKLAIDPQTGKLQLIAKDVVLDEVELPTPLNKDRLIMEYYDWENTTVPTNTLFNPLSYTDIFKADSSALKDDITNGTILTLIKGAGGFGLNKPVYDAVRVDVGYFYDGDLIAVSNKAGLKDMIDEAVSNLASSSTKTVMLSATFITQGYYNGTSYESEQTVLTTVAYRFDIANHTVTYTYLADQLIDTGFNPVLAELTCTDNSINNVHEITTNTRVPFSFGIGGFTLIRDYLIAGKPVLLKLKSSTNRIMGVFNANYYSRYVNASVTTPYITFEAWGALYNIDSTGGIIRST